MCIRDRYGYYLSADYCSGRMWGTKANDDNNFETIELYRPPFGNFVSFGYDLEKNIYVAADQGNIYRIDTFVLCTPNLVISATGDHIGCDADVVILSVDSLTGGTYAWYKDGQAIEDSNADTLTVTEEGVYSVQFIAEDCSAESLQSFEIFKNEDIEVTLLDLPAEYCVNGDPLLLSGDPAGGEFIGMGIDGSTFDPAISNVGTFTITYFYENQEGCSCLLYTSDAPTSDLV